MVKKPNALHDRRNIYYVFKEKEKYIYYIIFELFKSIWASLTAAKLSFVNSVSYSKIID